MVMNEVAVRKATYALPTEDVVRPIVLSRGNQEMVRREEIVTTNKFAQAAEYAVTLVSFTLQISLLSIASFNLFV